MTLAHDVIAPPAGDVSAGHAGPLVGQHSVVFLHGILGSRNNWKSFATRLVRALPGWRAITCDLRNHGESQGLPPPHTIEACADDVLSTFAALEGSRGGAPDVVVGHSFGGKVALEIARRAPAGLRETWVLDCPPGPRHQLVEGAGRDAIGGEVGAVLAAVQSVPMPVESRRALVESLRARGLSEALAQWMTTNLRAHGDALVWKFALDAVPEMLASFAACDRWDVVEEPAPGRGRLVLVRAGKGDRWRADDVARITRAAARGTVVDHVLPDAGHWLHTDDPETLLALLGDALRARGA